MSALSQIIKRVKDPIIRSMMESGEALSDIFKRSGAEANRHASRVIEWDQSRNPGGHNANVDANSLPNPGGDGPVVFTVRPGSTPAEVAQFRDYVNRSNDALAAGQLSPTGRVRTAGQIALEARAAARREARRAAGEGVPYQGVVAHVPDSTWVGTGTPPNWGDYTSGVNSSLAGQVGRYPEGYNPTVFLLED